MITSAFRSFLLLAILGIVGGCQSRSEKAALYNDRLIDQQIYVLEALNELDSSLNYMDTQRMAEAYQILQGRLKESLRSIEGIGDFDGDPQLKEATKDLLEGYDEIVAGPYLELIQLIDLPDSMFTPQQQLRAFEVEDQIIEGVKDLHQSFSKKQQSFGEKYKLIFEKDPQDS